MAGLDALAVGGGVTDPRDARHATGGLLAVQGPGALDVRTGVLWAPGTPALITGTSKTGPKMSVLLGPHVLVGSRGSANGPYLGPTLDQPLEVDVDLAPASGSRIDVVWGKQNDPNSGVPTPDVGPGPAWGVLTGAPSTGTPAKPDLSTIVGAVELGTITVAAGATSTNGSGVTISQTARQTVARGARIPVRNQAERDALTGFPGLEVYRLDTGDIELWSGIAGKWVTARAEAGPARCSVYQVAGGQQLPNATYQTIDFDGESVKTPASMHSTSSNISRVVVPAAGDYEVSGCVAFALNGSGSRLALIWRNGAPVQGSGGTGGGRPDVFALTPTTPVVVPCAAGDYFQVVGYHTAGVTLQSAAGSGQTSSLTVVRVG